MFTGIVEHVGTLVAREPSAGGARIVVELGPLVEGARIGESICVAGACLSIVAIDGAAAAFDLSHETLRRTTASSWRPGRRLDLERALSFGARLGGHLVSGHVDGVGRLLERRADGDGAVFRFALPEDGSVVVVEKGSVTIDGVSLTSFACRDGAFEVALIPHTLRATTLGDLAPGDAVNMEQDLVGRWIATLLEARR